MSETKILHVIPVLGRGGAPIMLSRLIQAIPAELGFHHEVLVLRELGHFEHDFDDMDVPLHTLNLRSPLMTLRAVSRLRSLIRSAGPDIVQGWMYHGNVAAVAGTSAGIPIVWNVRHSLHTNQGEKYLTQALIRFGPVLSQRVERIVFCSETSARQHFDIGYPSARSVVIPNGVNTDEFRPAPEGRHAVRAEVDLPVTGTLIGHAGRYHPVKNHLGLIRAFSHVAKRHSDATLVLAGRDVDSNNAELRDCLHNHRLERRVLLLGERSDMSRLLAAFDLYVSPSHSEAFPVGVLEAMACGVPVVATDVGDSRTLVGDSGRIVPPGDDIALAQAIDELLTIDEGGHIALRRKARFRVTQNYGLDRMACAYAELYGEVRIRVSGGPYPSKSCRGG